MSEKIFNWQQKGWPRFTFDRRALDGEIASFEAAFARVKHSLEQPQSPNAVMNALVDEAVKTSAIEGVRVDESVVMSSICKALGMTNVPFGFTKDARAEGVAQMVLSVKDDWNKSISANLIRSWHAALLANDPREITVGDFRSHADPMRVIRRTAHGEIEVRFEAPPSVRVPDEIERFVEIWRKRVQTPEAVALKATFLHPHFESIHPFEDGNGRVGRALVAKTIAEGLGASLVLPVSVGIDRHRKDYYEAIYGASRSLDWTEWAKFFIPVLVETLNDFISASQFVTAKGEYLSRYEGRISERAKKVILRMFQDGPAGVASGLSASKWVRMTKASKATATRDLEELAKVGAIIREGSGVATRYRLNFTVEPINEPINEPLSDGINDGIKQSILMLVQDRPGLRAPTLARRVDKSLPTVERAIAALVKAGRVEHRGSKKTGGYYLVGHRATV